MLGISRQAALKRYGALVAPTPTAPHVGRHEADRLLDEYEQILAEAARERRHRDVSADDEAIPW